MSREGAFDYILRSGVKKLVRTLALDGNHHLTKLGKAFFKEKYTVAGPCAGADPRPPQERPGLRAPGLPAHDLAERRAAEAERTACLRLRDGGGAYAGGSYRPICQAPSLVHVLDSTMRLARCVFPVPGRPEAAPTQTVGLRLTVLAPQLLDLLGPGGANT